MKFPRFYNPFRVIRDLQAALAVGHQTLDVTYKGLIDAVEENRRLRTDAARDAREYGELAQTLYATREELASSHRAAEAIGNHWHKLYCDVIADLDMADQALEAFMDEREEFKADIAIRDELGIELVAAGMEAEEAADAAETAAGQNLKALMLAVNDVERLEADKVTQAEEIIRIVNYIKAAEAELALAGVTLIDGENGPKVSVDPETLLSAVRLGLIAPVLRPEAA